MIRRFKKKRSLTLAALLLLLLSSGAVAYFTATGAGSGSATVGASSPLVLSASLSGGSLYPGTSDTVTFTATNSSAGHEYVQTVSLAGIKACTGAGSSWNTATSSCSNGGTEATTCEDYETGASDTTTKDFWMPTVTENQDIPNGSTALTTTGTLKMNDLSSNQNACQNANLYLTFTST